jgi:general secretion pathway protein A
MPAPQPERRASPPRTYETSYGLDERPFELVPDLRFLYHSTAHDRAMQSMLDAIRRRDAVVVLRGALGVGKTILCEAILEQLDRRTLTSLIADPLMSAEQFLRKVLLDFGVISAVDLSEGKLGRASRGDLLTALRDFLDTLPALEAFAVVIVDDAQNLSVDLLGQIRVLVEAGERDALLQVMLVGELSLTKPELRPLLRRVTTRSTLGPLDADEIGAYVAHRLSVASARPQVAFNDQALSRVHQLSGGLPRVVNLLCDRGLAVGQRSSARTINHRMIDAAAEELDLAPPASRRSVVYKAATTGLMLVLVMLGAAAGALVFRSHVTAWLNQWQQSPAAPSQPALPLPTPYTPTPADAAERAAQDLI